MYAVGTFAIGLGTSKGVIVSETKVNSVTVHVLSKLGTQFITGNMG